MFFVAVTCSSFHVACSSSHRVTKKQQARPKVSLGTNQGNSFATLNLEHNQQESVLSSAEKQSSKEEKEFSVENKFVDEKWKNGTWDLNMFVKGGRMDWDAVIVAEARRRKFLELHPEASTNQAPVLFRSSIIPWWAWIMRSHLPEAEILNGRAAMVGFFAAYLVDGLTGLDLVGQTGNFVCKAAVFAMVIGVILFRRRQDFTNLQKLADEATFYDRQWQASWQDRESK